MINELQRNKNSIKALVAGLELSPHPEGGFFRETYRSQGIIAAENLSAAIGGERPYCTSIYFLLPGTEFSALHRIRSDEIWHFYQGSPISIHSLSPEGEYRVDRLGDAAVGEFQVVVPLGHWFGATVDDPESFALVGCTVSPGFDFEDFELGTRKNLLAAFPQHAVLIERLTRD